MTRKTRPQDRINKRTPAAAGPDARLTISDLVARSGLTRRTVRYYVQRGLVDQPLGVRRGAWYTERHLRQLLAIRQLQDGNLTLDAIGRRIKGANAGARRDTQEEFVLGAAQMAPENDARDTRVIPIAPGLDLVVDTTEAGVDESVLPKFRTEIRRIYRAIRKEDSK